jgi:hypothetical protein
MTCDACRLYKKSNFTVMFLVPSSRLTLQEGQITRAQAEAACAPHMQHAYQSACCRGSWRRRGARATPAAAALPGQCEACVGMRCSVSQPAAASAAACTSLLNGTLSKQNESALALTSRQHAAMFVRRKALRRLQLQRNSA